MKCLHLIGWLGICPSCSFMHVLKYLFVCFVFLPILAISQSAESAAISKAIQAGKASQLSPYFASNVDLTLLNLEVVYSKEQAEVVLAKFFNENTPKSFTIKHEGKSKLDDYFYIGELVSTNGNYRLTFFLKNEGSTYRIRQLRIEN